MIPKPETNNAQVAVEAGFAQLKRSLLNATASGHESLEAYREAGQALIRLKDILPHGRFIKEVGARVHCTKQWSARLMKLAREWPDIMKAFDAAKTAGRTLGRSEFSVDGALAFVAKWRRNTGANSESTRRSGTRHSSAKAQESEALRQQLFATQFELGRARARIRALEAELRLARGVPDPQPIDPATMARAAKVAALWHRGAFAGERANAESRLRAMAKRFGRTLDEFIAECGLKSPADWTSAAAEAA